MRHAPGLLFDLFGLQASPISRNDTSIFSIILLQLILMSIRIITLCFLTAQNLLYGTSTKWAVRNIVVFDISFDKHIRPATLCFINSISVLIFFSFLCTSFIHIITPEIKIASHQDYALMQGYCFDLSVYVYLYSYSVIV